MPFAVGLIGTPRLPLVIFAVSVMACSPSKEAPVDMRPVPVDWGTLANKTLVFAHQSVGTDILSGARELADRDRVALIVVESESTPEGPGIWHFKVGTNGDPKSKIDAFVQAIDSGAAKGADLAALKLCYLDFSAASNASEIAGAYIRAIEDLQARHPETNFIAITAPLTVTQAGPKAWAKRLLGRNPAQLLENERRAQFNTKLRKHFGPNRLFDLAGYESVGMRTVQDGDLTIGSLNPELTYDGGHLNERGKLWIASQFLKFVAET